ncbi:unnamed protein product [Cylindrotheca closterium]|uniref:Uncharacterized protein n=1 Tax=Cylindrotheca closterium TaxID=2856 RepID=A0AAD2CN31_9STRA|nr:unnamed protein product [Cylindrotheca closterium]
MRLSPIETTTKALSPLVSNSLRASAIGWAAAGLETGVNTAGVCESVFGFARDPSIGVDDFDLDFSGAYVATSSYLEFVDVSVLLLLASTAILSSENMRRLWMGASIKHVAGLAVFALGIANGYEGGPMLPIYLGLEALTIAALFARFQEEKDEPTFEDIVPSSLEDFASVLDASRISSGSLVESFYRLGFFSALLVGASFAFSPVSPIAPVDVGETLCSKVLRAQYGISIAFLLTPISILQAEAVASGSLGTLGSRVLNVAYGALTGASAYFTLANRGEQVAKADVQAYESAFRWETNTLFAGGLAAIFVLFYMFQAFFPAGEGEEA